MIRTVVTAALTALAFSAAFAAPAVARDRVFTANLQSPVSAPVQFVGERFMWRCEGSACRATGTETAGLQECRRVSRRVGALASFGSEGNPFNADRLASCNTGAAAPAVTAQTEAPAETAEAAPAEAAPQTVAAQ